MKLRQIDRVSALIAKMAFAKQHHMNPAIIEGLIEEMVQVLDDLVGIGDGSKQEYLEDVRESLTAHFVVRH